MLLFYLLFVVLKSDYGLKNSLLLTPAGEGNKMADATTLLSMCDTVHLVLIKTDRSSETTLVSSYFLDWRTVLSSPSGKTCFAIELMGVGEQNTLHVYTEYFHAPLLLIVTVARLLMNNHTVSLWCCCLKFILAFNSLF